MFILKRKPAALDVVGSRGVKLFQPLVGDNPLLPSCEAVFSGKKKKVDLPFGVCGLIFPQYLIFGKHSCPIDFFF